MGVWCGCLVLLLLTIVMLCVQTIGEACDQALLKNSSRRLEEIKRKTGCSVRFEKLGDSRNELWVVSVIGGKDEVDAAARKIEDSW